MLNRILNRAKPTYRREKLRRSLMIETFEGRLVMAVAFMNELDSLDVSNDRNISAIDALQIINEINVGGSRTLPDTKPDSSFFVDSSGDGNVSPIDALLVINYLNKGLSSNVKRTLEDSSNFAAEEFIRIGNAAATGLRTYSMRLDTVFASIAKGDTKSDTFAVYLVRDDNSEESLINSGIDGSPLFALSSSGAVTLPGVTQFDGKVLSIDLAAVTVESPVLRLQLLNHDAAFESKVTAVPLSNAVNPDAEVQEAFQSTRLVGSIAGATSSPKSIATSVNILYSSPQFYRLSGMYEVDAELENTGTAIGRDTIVVFNNLPSGVTIANASGQTDNGLPYLNFRDAIGSGGLGTGEHSVKLRLEVNNPNNQPFALFADVLTGAANRPPVLGIIPNITVRPGEVYTLTVPASDPDGDTLHYGIPNAEVMPTTQILGNQITFAPTISQLGNYSFDVVVSDGVGKSRQTVQLAVVADTLTSTRLSGRILKVDDTPVVGMQVEVGAVKAVTDSTGKFLLDFGSVVAGDTLRVRADLLSGSTMPFIAEKIPLLLGRALYANVNNEIARPIYLPDLNPGTKINPAIDQNVSQALKANEAPASVQVKKGVLFNQSGSPFTGNLSITEVPATKTPAVLPSNLTVDTVVTIQPGEMSFASPAALTLPNRSKMPAGTLLDLWSINPTTGAFDKVGKGQVSADGLRIETIEGGIRYSSWHTFVPQPINPQNDSVNPGACGKPTSCIHTTSDVEVYSGNYIEHHTTPSYSSVGEDRSLTLVYSSKRVNSDAVIRFNTDLPTWFDRSEASNDKLGITINLTHGETHYGVPADGTTSTNSIVIKAKKTEGSDRVGAGVQIDMNEMPDGVFRYSANVGAFRSDGSQSIGSTSPITGQLVKISSKSSPYGSGWGIAGLQSLLVAADESTVLVVDGGGTELTFEKDAQSSSYKGPTGDFSVLTKNGNGLFQRRLKDGTTYRFNTSQLLETITDRNGNVTRYDYDGSRRLTQVTDPVGLITKLTYGALGLASIELPDGRKTLFTVNSNRDLVNITDPDGSNRAFLYDAKHRLTQEITPLGAKEVTQYDTYGRVSSVTRADGSTMKFTPAETKGTQYLGAPMIIPQLPAFTNTGFTQIVMPSGNVIRNGINSQGLVNATTDSVGRQSSYSRDKSGNVTRILDAKGNVASMDYDLNGNLVKVSTVVTSESFMDDRQGVLAPPVVELFSGLRELTSVALEDVSGDGLVDIIAVGVTGVDPFSQRGTVTLLVANSSGFNSPVFIDTGSDQPISVTTTDFDKDGHVDLLLQNYTSRMSILRGLGAVEFEKLVDPFPMLPNGGPIQIGDLNEDGFDDLIGFDNTSGKVVRYINTRSPELFDVGLDVNIGGRVDILRRMDINGDGIAEILAADKRGGPVRFIGTDGRVVAGANSLSALGTIADIEVTDLDGNQFDDVAIITNNPSALVLFTNNRDGTLVATSQQLINLPLLQTLELVEVNREIADLRGFAVTTGRPDYPLGLKFIKFANDALGASTDVPVPEVFPSMLRQSAAMQSLFQDIDHDGQKELVRVANGVQIWNGLTFGSGVVSPSLNGVTNTSNFVTGDFNGDHVDDVATLRNNGSLAITLGGAAFANNQPFLVAGITGNTVTTGFFDADDLLDVLVVSSTSATAVLGDQDAQFSRTRLIISSSSLPQDSSKLAVGDFNGDHFSDFAYVNVQNIFNVVASTESGTYVSRQQSVEQNVHSLFTADDNLDGSLDLYVISYTASTSFSGRASVTVFNNSGNGSFVSARRYDLGFVSPDRFGVAVGNLDLDSEPEIIFTGSGYGFIAINSTTTGFESTEVINYVGWAPREPRIVDIDGDGVLDVAFRSNFNGDSISYMLNDLSSEFDKLVSTPLGMTALSYQIASVVSAGQLNVVAMKAGGTLITRQLTANVTHRRKLESTIDYDSVFAQVRRIVDELGNVTTHDIDPQSGNILSVHRPLGYQESMIYLSSGLIDLHTDALGHVTDFDYDPFGRLVKVTSAEGTLDHITQTFGYDAIGNVSQATDANGLTTRFEYDSKRRLTKETDALGGVTTYTRDAAGNVLTVTDALNRVTRFTYDVMSRLTSTTDPLGQKTTYSFDTAGNLVAVVDPLGKVNRSVYDVANRQVRSIDASGGTTKFTYDGNDNLLTITDPVGNLTRYFYDERNRLVREQDPLLQSSFYLYDGADNLIAKRDRNDRQTSFIHDALNRQIEEKWLGVNTGELANKITSTFDLNSNLLSIADDASKLTFTYDSLDRVKTASNLGTPGQPSVLLTYGYAGSNLVTTTDSINSVSGATVAHQFDELNRLKTILQTGSGIATKRVDYTYNAIRQYSGITRSNNGDGSAPVVTTSLDYDDAYRLTMIDHRNATSTSLASFGFAYDAASRITQIVENGKAIDYSYDDRDQLTAANYADSSRTDETFVFDSNGNRTQSNTHGSAYRTGPANRLLTDGTFNYEYDKEGNLSKRTEIATGNFRDFQWDHRNRLVTVTDKNAGGISLQFVKLTYDALDRRISKSVDTTPNDAVDAAIEQYVYDGEDVILDFIDADGAGPAPATQSARYLRGPGIDNLLAIESNSQTLWVLQDQLGSTRSIVDQSGNLVQTIRYDAFGKALLDGQALTRYLFAGREIDTQTGLYYYRARYYDPATGKFVSEDPIRFQSGDTNLSRYVGNQPANFRDPLGLYSIDDFFGDINPYIPGFGFVDGFSSLGNLIGKKIRGDCFEDGEFIGEALMHGSNIAIGLLDIYLAGKFGGLGVGTKVAERSIGFTRPSLQHAYKHAGDFGVAGNATNKTLAAFSSAIQSHIDSIGTRVLKGTFRGNNVTFFVNPKTGLNVIRDASGNFLSGWKLSESQLFHVLKHKKL